MKHVAGVLVAVLLLALTACTGEDGGLRGSSVDVAAKDVRALKAKTDVAQCRPGTDALVGGGMPDVTLPCLGGGPDVNVSSLRGPMVINLWASWCGPCRQEMPIIQRFHERYGARVPVVGIDFQDVQPYAAMQLAAQSGVTYPLLADPQGALSAASPLPVIKGLPMMVLVDAQGRVVSVKAVAIRSLGQLEELVRTELGVRL
jgi:thiol-disulfide isomerase/thioredoxin